MNNQIKMLIKARGLTQTELGHRCRLDPAYLSKIILGHITPTIHTARKIASELGVGIDDLFPGTEEEAGVSAKGA